MERFRLLGNYLRRILIYAVGLLCLAFGVAFSVNSNLGVSPVNSLPYVISLVVKREMGSCVIAVFSFYILVQLVVLRREFHWINLTQLFFSALFGYFVDFAKWVLGSFALPAYPGQLMMLAISILLVAMGVCLYMNADLVNMPMEGMTHAINKKLFPNRSFHEVKVWMDCIVVAVGCCLSLIFMGGLNGIREGTVLCALLVGRVMKPLQQRLVPIVQKVAGGIG